MEKKNSVKETAVSGILLCVAIVLVLVDKFLGCHISAYVFYTGVYCISFPFVRSIVIKEAERDEFKFAVTYIVLYYMIFLYLSVYYRFIPAGKGFGWSTIIGEIPFFLINAGFIIVLFFSHLIVVIVEVGLLKNSARNFIIRLLGKIFGIVLIIAITLLLYMLMKFLLSLGFKDSYRDVIIGESPHIMISLMNFLIGA